MLLMDIARNFRYDLKVWGPRVAWLNLRFLLGYRIGGFKRASR
jgi:hypothetical protein